MGTAYTTTLPPLTHHEILELIEAFARHGQAVDMAATDRPARRIVFRSTPVSLPATPGVAWLSHLELDNPSDRHFLLRRVLQHPQGPRAELAATGQDPAELLARIDAVPPARQVKAGPGWLCVTSYNTQLPGRQRAPHTTAGPPLVMSQARVHAGHLTLQLHLHMPSHRNVAADLRLTSTAATLPALPEDLLAVQGWDWARLIPDPQGWTSKLRLRGAVLRRTRKAEAALEQAGTHLAQVLAEPPAAFHDRHRWARWGVVLRRSIPSLTSIFMIVGALLLPRLLDPEKAGLWMALHYVPIALLAFAFQLQELARFEIPPLPRRPRAQGWDNSGETVRVI